MIPPHLSPFTEAGHLIFISGQLAFDSTGKISQSAVTEQTTQALQNIEAILVKVGLTIKAVVKTTVWLRRETDFADFNRSYAAYLGDHRPARSTVISGLALPEALVEIEAVALRSAR